MGELVRKKVYCLVRAKIQWTEVVYKVISILKNLNAVKNRTWLHRRPQIAHLWPSPRDFFFFFFFSTDFLSLGLPTIYKSTIAISSSHCVAISYATNLIPTMHYILFIFFLTPIFFVTRHPILPNPLFAYSVLNLDHKYAYIYIVPPTGLNHYRTPDSSAVLLLSIHNMPPLQKPE